MRVYGIKRVDYTADEIHERLLLAMINEAADILQEGNAKDARDIDLATVFGYGFPRWRVELMHYADPLGAKWIVLQLDRFCNQDPVVWKISSPLQSCATNNNRIDEYS